MQHSWVVESQVVVPQVRDVDPPLDPLDPPLDTPPLEPPDVVPPELVPPELVPPELVPGGTLVTAPSGRTSASPPSGRLWRVPPDPAPSPFTPSIPRTPSSARPPQALATSAKTAHPKTTDDFMTRSPSSGSVMWGLLRLSDHSRVSPAHFGVPWKKATN
jgi:hypothetical protein